jgi:L-amino acid N-acyltransferase YncA
MKVRDATEADLPAIVAIFNATVPTRMVTAELEPVTVERRLPWFRQHTPDRHPLWVAESDGVIAGWISLESFRERCAYRATAEVSVYVREDFRRCGIGRYLLRQAIDRSPSLEINALVGCIFGHNRPSLHLFEQLGFERWGLLPRIARLDELDRDLVIVGLHLASIAPRSCNKVVRQS